MPELISFLGVVFHAMSPQEAVHSIVDRARRRHSTKVLIANANSFSKARRNPEMRAALRSADLLLADGSGVLWGSAFLGTPIKHNLNGTDLIPLVCAGAAQQQQSVFLFGGQPGVAQEAADRMREKFPGLRIVGIRQGYFSPEETPAIIDEIRASDAQILLVALGSPRQESWIDTHASELPGVVCISVGGLFDFVAGRVRRAPLRLRRWGLEWMWRIAMEPRRLFLRYLVGNTMFIAMVLGAWCSGLGRRKQPQAAPSAGGTAASGYASRHDHDRGVMVEA